MRHSLCRPSRSDFVQYEFIVEDIQTESDSIENEVQKQVSENIEDENHSLNWKYIIVAIIVVIFVVGIIFKVFSKSIGVKTGKIDWEANGTGKISEESGGKYEKEKQFY